MLKTFSLLTATCCFIVGCHSSSLPPTTEENACQRWAILASEEVQATGLPELLFADLSLRPGLELVERSQLDLALKELELSSRLGELNPQQQLQLGRVLRADGLLILTTSQPIDRRVDDGLKGLFEMPRFMVTSMVDCSRGVRLHAETFSFPIVEAEFVASRLGSLLQQTQERFADGVKHVVMVKHLHCVNVSYDYDRIADDFTRTVVDALTTIPGCAVVEMNAGRSIREELDLEGSDQESGLVRLTVEGEFEVSTRQTTDDLPVSLSLSIRNGRRVLHRLEPEGLTLSTVPEYLCSEVVRQVDERCRQSNLVPLSRSEQAAALVEQAEEALGRLDLQGAVQLREAALLLEDSSDQRRKLIDDYLRTLSRLRLNNATAPQGTALPPSSYTSATDCNAAKIDQSSGTPESDVVRGDRHLWDALVKERMCRWRALCNEVEYVVRRHMVNQEQACDLILQVSQAATTISPQYSYSRRAILIPDEIFTEAMAFPHKMTPLLDHLEPMGTDDASNARINAWILERLRRIVKLWQYPLVSCKHDTDGRPEHEYGATYALDQLYWFLSVLGRSNRLDKRLTDWLRDPTPHPNFKFRLRRASIDNALALGLCDRLEAEDSATTKTYARLMRLFVALWVPYRGRDPRPAEALEDLRAVVEQLEICGIGGHTSPSITAFTVRMRQTYEIEVRNNAKILRRMSSKPTSDRTATSPPASLRSTPEKKPLVYDSLPMEAVDGIDASQWVGWKRCEASLDVMWSPNELFVMSRPGEVRKVWDTGDQGDGIAAVDWDGEHIWLACGTSGVHIVAPSGGRSWHCDSAQGLPPYTQIRSTVTSAGVVAWLRRYPPIRLHATGDGRCIVIGRLKSRIWFAEISRDTESEYIAKVFHRATKWSPVRSDDPSEQFTPTWIVETTDPANASRRILLIGRDSRARPVVIDIDTLEVSVLERDLPSFRWPVIALDDRLLFIECMRGRPYVKHSAVEYSWTTGEWRERNLADVQTNYAMSPPKVFGRFHLANDGPYFVSNWAWYEIDVGDDCRVIPLTPNFLADESQFGNHAASAHYGMVAWNSEVLNSPGRRPGRGPNQEPIPGATYSQPIGQVYRLIVEP